MKLGVIFDRLDPRRGGAEACLDRLLRELMARGHEVVVYAMEDDEGPWRTRRGAPRRWTRGARERDFAAWASATAREEGCEVLLGVRHVRDVDVYQPHGGTWAATVEGKDRARAAGPLARLWRRMSGRHRVFAAADAAVFARRPPPITLAVSEMVRDDVLRRYASLESDLRVLWPAVERTPRSEPGRRRAEELRARLGEGDAPRFLFVAHQFREKGLEPALRALAELRDPAARLIVVGRGDATRYRALGRRLGVEAQLEFLGATHGIEDLLEACDVLVHPTFYDPCALVCLEARESGCPVVTTAHNGAAALLEGRGVVVDDPRDVPRLAQAMREAAAMGRLERPLSPDLRWSTHVDAVERALLEARR